MPQTSPCAFLQPTAKPVASGTARPGTLLPGERVGVWRIDEALGGTAYAVTRVDSGLPAVLAEIDAPALVVGSYLEALRPIVERLRPLRHPGITDLYDAGTLGDGRPFIVIERLSGVMLALRLAEGRLNADDAVEILLDIAEPLAVAHDAGVVHGGLAAETVLLVDDDRTRVKLLDWGVARAIAHEARQADRIAWSPATPPSCGPEDDIAALGAIAKAMFRDDVPIELDDLLDAMTDEDPRERPAIDEVIARLEEVHLGPALERFELPPARCLVAPDDPASAGYGDEPLDVDDDEGGSWRVRVATIATVCIVIAIVIAGIARAHGSRPGVVAPPAAPVTPAIVPTVEARPPVIKTSMHVAAPAPAPAVRAKPSPAKRTAVKPAPAKPA
ncbi:MAG: protein kinase domain-containing protein, partial [Acidobacteriota bacterium]